MILHIATELATTGTLKQSGLGGSVLPWFETWHEGPVREGPSRDEIAQERLEYFNTAQHGDPYDERSFFSGLQEIRGEAFEHLDRFDEIVFWFNSTAGEQLNLIDVLSQLQAKGAGPSRFTRVAAIEPLQAHSSKQLRALGTERPELHPELVRAAPSAWRAFRASDPRVLERFIATHASEVPELCSALERFLEELPSTMNGLSRFEQLILSALSESDLTAMAMMVGHCDEWADPLFSDVGDRTLRRYLIRLGQGPAPLIEFADRTPLNSKVVWGLEGVFFKAKIRLTAGGQHVLGGEDYLELSPPRRWLGAYRLGPGCPDWRWNPAERRVSRGTVS